MIPILVTNDVIIIHLSAKFELNSFTGMLGDDITRHPVEEGKIVGSSDGTTLSSCILLDPLTELICVSDPQAGYALCPIYIINGGLIEIYSNHICFICKLLTDRCYGRGDSDTT